MSKRVFPAIRHNELRNLCEDLLTEVCPNVCVWNSTCPLSGEQLTTCTASTEDGARLDVTVNGFWGGRFEHTFFDVRVFNPNVPSNQAPQMTNIYWRHACGKCNKYEQWI